MTPRYWLRLLDLPWQEATAEQFRQAERVAGFSPGVSNSAFVGGCIAGMVNFNDEDPNQKPSPAISPGNMGNRKS